jgi:hypothetical protein
LEYLGSVTAVVEWWNFGGIAYKANLYLVVDKLCRDTKSGLFSAGLGVAF